MGQVYRETDYQWTIRCVVSRVFAFFCSTFTDFVCWICLESYTRCRADGGSQHIVEEMGREFDVLWVMEGHRHCPRPCFGKPTETLRSFSPGLRNMVPLFCSSCILSTPYFINYNC